MDKDRVELLIKSVIRTDGYLNYANTKSTILLTLASGVLATASLNLSKLLPLSLDKLSTSSFVSFSFFLVIGVLINILSVVRTLKAISPYLKNSDKENIFSFVDIVHYNSSSDTYSEKIKKLDYSHLGEQLTSLNYNLSVGLLDKYKNQRRAIILLKISMASFFLSIVVPWFFYCFDISLTEKGPIVIMLLFIISLVVFIIFLLTLIIYLLYLGKDKK